MERFWSRVNKDGPVPANRPEIGPCWLWRLSVNSKGYPNFYLNNRTLIAHRFAYELAAEPIPSGLVLDHLCRTPRCVNPAHLEPVTHRVNILRGVGATAQHARQTHCKEGHPFTPENTYRQRNARRTCRRCNADAVARYKARREGMVLV